MNMKKELGNNREEPKEPEIEQNPWYDYNNNIANNNEKLLNETIITLVCHYHQNQFKFTTSFFFFFSVV
jgi:hypothetical protein